MGISSLLRSLGYVLLGLALVLCGLSFWYFNSILDDESDAQISTSIPVKAANLLLLQSFGAVVSLALVISIVRAPLDLAKKTIVYISDERITLPNLRGPPSIV